MNVNPSYEDYTPMGWPAVLSLLAGMMRMPGGPMPGGPMPGVPMPGGPMPGMYGGPMPGGPMPGMYGGPMPGGPVPGMFGGPISPPPSGPMTALTGGPGRLPRDARCLMHLLRTMEAAIPAHEVLHSLHTEAIRDPAVRELPAMHRFDTQSLKYLNAMMAAAGYIRRILSGDQSEPVRIGLRDQLGMLQPARDATEAALRELAESEAGRANAAVQTMIQVARLVDRAHRAIMAAAEPLVTMEVGEE